MSNLKDFEIYDGMLVSYLGQGGEVVIPEGITRIASGAFDGCSLLTGVRIPDSITSIGNDVFFGCDNLTFNVKNGLKYLGNESNPYIYLADVENASIKTATVEEGCKIIGWCVFKDCGNLTSIIIPNSVKCIGDDAFRECCSLISINLPNGITDIGNFVFQGCDNLTSLIIPDSVTNIGYDAFEVEKIIIKARPNTCAENYAKENGIKFEEL